MLMKNLDFKISKIIDDAKLAIDFGLLNILDNSMNAFKAEIQMVQFYYRSQKMYKCSSGRN